MFDILINYLSIYLSIIHCTPLRPGYITACDQTMVESGVTESAKNNASFLFREWTQQHKYEASS